MNKIRHPINYDPKEMDAFDTPIYNFFGNSPMFSAAVMIPSVQFDKLESDYGALIHRSSEVFPTRSRRTGRWESSSRKLLLKMDDDTFVLIESSRRLTESYIYAFSSKQEKARHWVKVIAERYPSYPRKQAEKATFSVVTIQQYGPETETVEISRSFQMSDDTLQLLYGDSFPAWETELLSNMRNKETGVLLFQGPPGTGKTSYIRHLVDKLRKTHRFYYMPVSNQELLTNPNMVSFWVGENRNYKHLRKVVILEDAELLLEHSSRGRSGAVANLLNIADGLLGEMLKVQLLCTINCDLDRLDEAITRPGRLIGFREFPRLTPSHAARIAEKHNCQLPQLPDYALSDIFSSRSAPMISSRKSIPKTIGFGMPT